MSGKKSKKICFVVMGFGRKMDYQNAREVDLDKIYGKVIRPLMKEKFPEYKVIRADEIRRSELIDVSMYTLLMEADLVIADITTLNANALYELGVRHAVRPCSTIIMAQKNRTGMMPFDLSHDRFLTYEPYGHELDDLEAAGIRAVLYDYIVSTEDDHHDSPLYTYLTVRPPRLRKRKREKVFRVVERSEKNISEYIEEANSYRKDDKFFDAYKIWKVVHEMIPNNEYVIQQMALTRYKSKIPNEERALRKGLDIINMLVPEHSLNTETLGITGAIYKRLYKVTNDHKYLDKAIRMYQKGYVVKEDYYNGENYANCLIFKASNTALPSEEQTHWYFFGKKIYSEVIDLLQGQISELDDSDINKWMYATLSTSYHAIEDQENYEKYRKLFECSGRLENWELDTYKDNLKEIDEALEKIKG